MSTDQKEQTGPLVELRSVSRQFDISAPWLNRVVERKPRQVIHAVDDVSLAIPRGKTVGLVGESGCGKSTLARVAVGLHRPDAGQVYFDGVDIASHGKRVPSSLRRRMQMIFQDPYASLNPRWRVGNIISEPMIVGNDMDGAAVTRRVDELLRQVGLTPQDARKFPHEFSGGQRQRISIARALASRPEFLVCDEPTSALDVSVQAQILNLMSNLQDELGLTYLFISHNLAVIRHIADYVGVMYLGRLVEVAPVQELFEAPKHPYTRLLLAAIPDIAVFQHDYAPVSGELPNPIDIPPGCSFAPRCRFVGEKCRTVVPQLKQDHRAVSHASVACHAADEGRLPLSGLSPETANDKGTRP